MFIYGYSDYFAEVFEKSVWNDDSVAVAKACSEIDVHSLGTLYFPYLHCRFAFVSLFLIFRFHILNFLEMTTRKIYLFIRWDHLSMIILQKPPYLRVLSAYVCIFFLHFTSAYETNKFSPVMTLFSEGPISFCFLWR